MPPIELKNRVTTTADGRVHITPGSVGELEFQHSAETEALLNRALLSNAELLSRSGVEIETRVHNVELQYNGPDDAVVVLGAVNAEEGLLVGVKLSDISFDDESGQGTLSADIPLNAKGEVELYILYPDGSKVRLASDGEVDYSKAGIFVKAGATAEPPVEMQYPGIFRAQPRDIQPKTVTPSKDISPEDVSTTAADSKSTERHPSGGAKIIDFAAAKKQRAA